MRRSLSVIGSFCLGIGLSIAVLACADDNLHPTSSPEIHINDFMPTILGCSLGVYHNLNFNYDDNGRLIAAKGYVDETGVEISHNISYSGTTITIVKSEGSTYTRTSTITVTEDDIENVQAYNLASFLLLFRGENY